MAKNKTVMKTVDEQFDAMVEKFGGPKYAMNRSGTQIRFELKKIDMGRDFDDSRCVGVMSYWQTKGRPFEKKPATGWPIRKGVVVKFWGDKFDLYDDNLYCVVDDWENRNDYWTDSYLKVVQEILDTFEMKPVKSKDFAPGSFAQNPDKL